MSCGKQGWGYFCPRSQTQMTSIFQATQTQVSKSTDTAGELNQHPSEEVFQNQFYSTSFIP